MLVEFSHLPSEQVFVNKHRADIDLNRMLAQDPIVLALA